MIFTLLTKKIFTIFLFCVFLISNNVFSQSWNAIGPGTNGQVNAAILYNGQLLAAGSFSTPGSNISMWSGTAWSNLGTGINGPVYAVTIFNGNLVVAGSFTMAGGNPANNIAQYNGTTWSGLGLGTNDTVFALALSGTTLRVGGSFTTAGGVICNRLATWSGTAWSSMPGGATNGLNNTVYAMVPSGATDIFIGGRFTLTGAGATANRIIRYNTGSGTYFSLGTGVDNNMVSALLIYGGQLYVGGSFSTIGGTTVNNIARWTGSNWLTVSTGTNGTVRSFGLSGANLIVGGSFANAGTATGVNNIASWNGTTFSALGSGLTGGGPSVNAITVWSNLLIAGGLFTTPGNNIAGFGSLPAAPTLLSPPNGSTGVSVTPTLDWSDVSNATTYGIQVSTNAGFSPMIVNVTGLTVSQYTTGVLNNNVIYHWRAFASNGLGQGAFSSIFTFVTAPLGININTTEIPKQFNLYQNYPNPFNPVTKIRFDLPANNTSGSKINLIVYDINGKEVSSLVNTDYTAGIWEVDFNAANLSSGVYFYKLTAGSYNALNKMILIK